MNQFVTESLKTLKNLNFMVYIHKDAAKQHPGIYICKH
jgi:hypothetical protein